MVNEIDREKSYTAKTFRHEQLKYLFSVRDTVCFHAVKNFHLGDERDDRFAEILDRVVRTENYGMNVLRIYLKPTKPLKNYLMSFK